MTLLFEKESRLPSGFASESKIVAIGDVHGQIDLLRNAISSVEDKSEKRLILLGDYIDRGPDSYGVLTYVNQIIEDKEFKEVITLPGNHDGMCWRGLALDDAFDYRCWINNGGAYFADEVRYDYELIKDAFPQQLADRITGKLPAWVQDGNLLFVHAGLHPERDTKKFLSQPYLTPNHEEEHWAWVREPFLYHEGGHKGLNGEDVIIVHGHTRTQMTSLEAVYHSLERSETHRRINLDASGTGYQPVLEVDGDKMTYRLVDKNINLSLDY